jgi:pimeloyl-ACP methyl ester carboxylesterase
MIIIISLYLIAGTLLYVFQRSLLYFPTQNSGHTNDTENFSNDNKIIEVLTLNKGKSNALIYFGGNGESVGYNLIDGDFLEIFADFAVYLLSYRGYGGSSGTPSERAICGDAIMLYDRIAVNHDTVSIMGRSLGSGVATYVASKKEVHKIALITPFDSIQSVAQSRFWMFPMALIIKDKYDSFSRVDNIKAKVLVMIAQNDHIISNKHTTRLVNKFSSEQIKAITIKDVGHATISETEEYHKTLKQFFTQSIQ